MSPAQLEFRCCCSIDSVEIHPTRTFAAYKKRPPCRRVFKIRVILTRTNLSAAVIVLLILLYDLNGTPGNAH